MTHRPPRFARPYCERRPDRPRVTTILHHGVMETADVELAAAMIRAILDD